MIPFFMWVREPKRAAKPAKGAVTAGLRDLWRTIRKLPRAPSLACFLGSSMFYRDALNGMYTFGGIYATGVLGWTVVDIGVFGILAVIAGAVASYLGGIADKRFGPKPVIICSILILLAAAIGIVLISREAVFLVPVAEGSMLPDYAFYLCGCLTGAGGGRDPVGLAHDDGPSGQSRPDDGGVRALCNDRKGHGFSGPGAYRHRHEPVREPKNRRVPHHWSVPDRVVPVNLGETRWRG